MVMTAEKRRLEGNKRFIFHFLGSKTPTVSYGRTVSEAFMKAGYGGGAIRALDYYEEKEED